MDGCRWLPVTYRPFDRDVFFRLDTGDPVTVAVWARLDATGLHVVLDPPS